MKKITALLLALLLFLPTMAMAEILEFDDFTLEIKEGDVYELGSKGEGEILFMLYPAYDPNATVFPNINCTWTSASIATDLKRATPMQLAESIMTSAVSAFAQQGIAATNGQVVAAEGSAEDGYMVTYTIMDLDYSGMGIDLQITQHQLQAYMPLGPIGTYVFTFTADSQEGVEALSEYINAITRK